MLDEFAPRVFAKYAWSKEQNQTFGKSLIKLGTLLDSVNAPLAASLLT
jgi:hypothetical protein